MAYDTRENFQPGTNPEPGEDTNLPLRGRIRMNIVHEGTSTKPIPRQMEGAKAPYGLIDDDQHHKQMLRDSPTFEGVWQDGRTSSRGSKRTGLPIFVSIAYDSKGLHP
jgi:hypothetical protein